MSVDTQMCIFLRKFFIIIFFFFAVPLRERGHFLSIWCQIVVENFHKIQRFLVVFWPLFMIRSNLPVDVKVNIETPTLHIALETTIAGRGKLQQLYCPGTTDHSHQLTFKLE